MEDLLKLVRECLAKGSERYSKHANDRLQSREVTRQEVRQVLTTGYHEKRKDVFDEQYGSWHYSIRGKSIDGRSLRIVVSFDARNMIVITVIDLMKKGKS